MDVAGVVGVIATLIVAATENGNATLIVIAIPLTIRILDRMSGTW